MKQYFCPEDAGISSEAINDFIRDLADVNARIHALILLDRDGIVYADVAAPYSLDTPHRLFSAAKSIFALGLLKAVELGKLRISDHVVDFFPEYKPIDEYMAMMTVEDLLTMRTGQIADPFVLLFNNFDEDLINAFFNTAVEEKPGTHFRYNNTVPHIICAVTERATMEPFDKWFNRQFADVMDATIRAPYNSKGQYNPVITSVSANSFLRYTMLFLRSGDWFGRRLIDSSFIEQATREHTASAEECNHDGYGYQIWRNSFGGYRMDGGWGQYAIILPECGYAAVILSDMTQCRPILSSFEKKLLPSFMHNKTYGDSGSKIPHLEKIAPISMVEADMNLTGNVYCFKNGDLLRVSSCNHGLKFEYTVDNQTISFSAGTDGEWIANDHLLLCSTFFSIDQSVYGVEDKKFYLSGGWISHRVFECVGKTFVEMGEHRYRFEFEKDCLKIIHTPGMTHDISSLSSNAVVEVGGVVCEK